VHSFVQQRPLYSLYAAENDRFIAAPQYPAKQLQKDMLGPSRGSKTRRGLSRECSTRFRAREFQPVGGTLRI
jgi:hypothetical protein